MDSKILRYANAAALLLVLAVNWLADAIPIGGKTTGQISAMYPVGITPAPYAFSIWGLIYALLTVFAILQFVPSVRRSPEFKAIGPWFLVSCAFNIGWILVWHYNKVNASVFLMLGLLLSLIAIYWLVRPNGWAKQLRVRYGVQLPFSIYLGWVSVATIVNITVALYNAGWSGFGLSGNLWTVILILLAAALAVTIGTLFRDSFFIAVAVWALSAVGVANKSIPSVAWSAWLVSGLLALYAIYILLLVKKHVR